MTSTAKTSRKYNTRKQADLLGLMGRPISVADLSVKTRRTPNALGAALNLMQSCGLCRPDGFGEPSRKGGPHPVLWVRTGSQS